MKVASVATALFALSLAPSAFAGVLSLENGAKQLNGVTLSQSGSMSVQGRGPIALTTKGAGIRTALGGFVKAYVGEILVSDPSAYACGGDALNSLDTQKAVAVHVSVTFSFDKSKLLEAFNEGFATNNVSTGKQEIKDFLAAVQAGGNAPSGSHFNFLGEKNGAEEFVTYEDSNGQVTTIKGGAGFIKDIFSLWLGETDDNGLKSLHSNLVNCTL